MSEWDGKSDQVVWQFYADEETRDLYEREGRPTGTGHAEVEWEVPNLSFSGTLTYEPNAVTICHPDFGLHIHDEAFYRELRALALGVKAIAAQLPVKTA